MFIFMEPTSPKGRDLQRDDRFAMHCGVENNEGGKGEFFLSGRATLIEDPAVRSIAIEHASYQPADRYILFELSPDSALGTVYEDSGPQRRRWERKRVA
jgi:hypothetical protein